ncbi:MAG: sugar-binding domain-containing protein [Trueperaceae bacterium]
MSVSSTRISSPGKRVPIDPAYPRPQFRRRDWLSLDGSWSFSPSEQRDPSRVKWTHTIQVPFPPESRLSGLALDEELPVVWYRRTFRLPPEWQGSRFVLHFGAVDYRCEVWLNGHRAGGHEGGHTPFAIEVTDLLAEGEQVLSVRAEDPPTAFDMPRGKQDWKPAPHSIWYPRTTGIWQSVWLEPLAHSHIAKLRLTPDLTRFAVTAELEIAGAAEALELEFDLSLHGRSLAKGRVAVLAPTFVHTLHLADPGIDDARNELLWSPERPTLLDLTLTLRGEAAVFDRVESYVGMRSIETREGRFYLNGRPYFQRLVLDQGYWSESLLAPPSGEALKADVELAKAMGFNGVRKHQKLEDPRYLYWADRLGLLVWSELPSAYSFGSQASRRLVHTWLEAIERDFNHPSVVAWVPINESWGVPDLPASSRQRNLVAGLYRLTKALDDSRAVIDNDGWEHGTSDLFTVHDYSHDPSLLERRYGDRERWRSNGQRFTPGGRSLVVDGEEPPEAVFISEFGGIRYGEEAGGWGYSEADSSQSLLDRISGLVAKLKASDAIIGFCYTQFADTFQEQNGLLFADRRPKIPLEALAEVIGEGGRS